MHAVLVEGEGGLETEVREKRSKEDWTLEDLHGERPSIIIRSGKGWECVLEPTTSGVRWLRLLR